MFLFVAGGQTWFNPFDCASWVIRALDELGSLGAQFNQSVHLNYTKINIYSAQPIYQGSSSEIFGKNANNTMKELGRKIYDFYKKFQSSKSDIKLAEEILMNLFEFFIERDSFYLYYNDAYWILPLHDPVLKLTYEETPLPNPGRKKTQDRRFQI